MKIQGKKIEGRNVSVIVIPRESADDIVFKAEAVLDMEPFEKLCPVPDPPKKMLPGGRSVTNPKSKGYLKEVTRHSEKRLTYIVLMSLQATEGLEWETVDLSDHTTWENFRKELRDSGFSNVEVNRIIGECIDVNALSDEKIDAARERFLLEAQGPDDE